MKKGQCPVCKTVKLIQTTDLDAGGEIVVVWVPQLMYQRTYLGEPEYVSPRCYECYAKAERRLLEKKHDEVMTNGVSES